MALPPWLGSQEPCPRRLGGGSLASLYKKGDDGVPPRPGSRCDGVTSLCMYQEQPGQVWILSCVHEPIPHVLPELLENEAAQVQEVWDPAGPLPSPAPQPLTACASPHLYAPAAPCCSAGAPSFALSPSCSSPPRGTLMARRTPGTGRTPDEAQRDNGTLSPTSLPLPSSPLSLCRAGYRQQDQEGSWEVV